MEREQLEQVATEVVDAAFKVHRTLGPGLLENVYQVCLSHDLRKRGLSVRCEVPLPVAYDNIRLATGYRLDMLVAGQIVVENKAVRALAPVHTAQLPTYLKLSDLRLGFLINWNVHRIKEGLNRIVNNL